MAGTAVWRRARPSTHSAEGVIDTQVRGAPAGERRPAGRRRPAALWWAVASAGCVVLFLGYLRMARTQATNSDGASNALQAWDMLHGNVLLHGWTLSDVSFYTTELPEYALVELLYGLRAGVVQVAAALTYTLLVLAAVVLAKGRATGLSGLVRAGTAVAIIVAPQPGMGHLTMLNAPDHTGSGLPVLVTWIVLERALTRPDGTAAGVPRAAPRWLPYAIAVLLAWGSVADPLITVTAALPLIALSALRAVRRPAEAGSAGGGPIGSGFVGGRSTGGGSAGGAGSAAGRWRGLRGRLRGVDGQLLAAGIGGVLLARAVLLGIHLAGGFSLHGVSTHLATPGQLGRNAWITAIGLAVDLGVYPPDMHSAGAYVVGAAHLIGLGAILVAAVRVAVRSVRAPGGEDRVAPLLAFGILANVVAFLLSTLPVDALSARQIVSVLPMGAVLAGRVYGPLLAHGRGLARRTATVARAGLAAAALVVAVAFGVQSLAAHPVPAANEDVALWLAGQRLEYGLGGYWSSNVITLVTGGRVRVAPVSGSVPDQVLAYRWESRADWFDPARHDARFLVLDLQDPAYGRVEAAVNQFGPFRARKDFGRFAVLLYDHNLLAGLPALCGGGLIAASMAEC